jgi:selenocysteine lyase/cysteine desulfurase
MERRDFLIRGGLAIGAAAAASGPAMALSRPPAKRLDPGDWSSVREQFDLLEPGKAHLAGFFLVSHPRPVREAIDKYRKGLDANPLAYWEEHRTELENNVRSIAGDYLGVKGTEEVALTDSTTMGLAMLYTGLVLREGQEILTSTHDHPAATVASLRLRNARTGTKVNTVPLYANSAAVSVDEVVSNVERNLTPKTRVVALTWVHSCTGVKIPVRAIADALARANKNREEGDRALLCIDGVHGLGVDAANLPDLGCDFFAAGTHKWIFSPRGTGILWGRASLWAQVIPTIPPFGMGGGPATLYTPGGFHSFEHRWAATEGFRMHLALGKRRIHERLNAMNRLVREGLSKMPHVDLHTPMSDDLSAGITCFDVKGKTPKDVVAHLESRNVIGSVSPYTPSCARLAVSLWNTEAEVEAALKAVREMA